jgi:hypothetical protein
MRPFIATQVSAFIRLIVVCSSRPTEGSRRVVVRDIRTKPVGSMWTRNLRMNCSGPPMIYLGGVHDIGGFRYVPRQDGCSSGRIIKYVLYISSGGTNWGTAVVTGTIANDATERSLFHCHHRKLHSISSIERSQWESVYIGCRNPAFWKPAPVKSEIHSDRPALCCLPSASLGDRHSKPSTLPEPPPPGNSYPP